MLAHMRNRARGARSCSELGAMRLLDIGSIHGADASAANSRSGQRTLCNFPAFSKYTTAFDVACPDGLC